MLNKFNDIHIQKNDIISFYNETNGSLDTFETTLKSFLIFFFIHIISYLKLETSNLKIR